MGFVWADDKTQKKNENKNNLKTIHFFFTDIAANSGVLSHLSQCLPTDTLASFTRAVRAAHSGASSPRAIFTATLACTLTLHVLLSAQFRFLLP